MFVKLRYNTTVELANGTIGVNHAFRGNSLYDPEVGVASDQPYAFDQWSAFYSNYRVHGSKIRVQAAQFPVTGDTRWVLTLVPVTQNSVVDAVSMREMPRRKMRVFTSQYGGIARVGGYASTCSIWGVAKSRARQDPAFEAPIISDPTNQWYWWLRCDPWSPSAAWSGPVNVRGIITVTYYVEFRGRKWLNLSEN